MVSINTAIFLSPEYEKLKQELKEQRAEYSEAFLEYETLTRHTLKNLTNEYLNAVGHKEYRLYSLGVEIQRHRRMLSLYQQALNRKTKISATEVNQVIQKEFEEYTKELDQLLIQHEDHLRTLQAHLKELEGAMNNV